MRIPVFICLFFVSLTLNASNEPNTAVPAANQAADGALTDGALVIEEKEKTTDPSLPVAENIDLKEVVPDAEPLAVPENKPEQKPENKPQKETATAANASGDSASKTEATPAAPAQIAESETGSPATHPEATPAVPPVEQQPSLKLLASEVLPGTSARLAWEPGITFMGISAPTAVLVVNGTTKGPTLCLTSAVHGDELNGIEMVRHILYNIDVKNLSGAVIGVPIVNLQGFRRSSRYLPDRRDLNRYFPGNPNGSAASRIAYSFFEDVVRHCDMLVDIHTGSFKRTNLPQLRADLAYKKVADLTGKMGSIVVVQSRGHAGSLRRAAVEYGIPAVTLEAGEPHILDKHAVDQGVKSIQTLMHASDMAKILSFWELRRGPVYYKSRWVRSVNGGILFSTAKLGDLIKRGDVLGTVTDPITNLSTDIVSPHNGRVIGMALNQVLYPGYAAYHIGLQAPVSEAAVDESPDPDPDPEDGDSLDNPSLDNAGEALPPGAPSLSSPERAIQGEESEAVMEVQILEDSE